LQAAQYDVDRQQPAERLQEDGVITDREIAPFDERETQIAREVGVFEVGRTRRTGRQ
jgi:hypothetical protein